MSSAENDIDDRPVGRRFPNPLERSCRTAWRLTLAAAVLAGLAAPFGIAGLVIAAVFGTFALIGGFTAAVLAHYRRRYAEELDAFARGEWVAHWSYSREEWERHLEAERAVHALGDRSPFFIGLFAGGVLAAIIAFAGPAWNGSRLVPVAAALAGGAAFGTVLQVGRNRVLGSKLRKLEQSEPEAIVGRRGLYFGGDYRRWGMFGQSLEEVEFHEGPPAVLEFRFRITAGDGDFPDPIRVPVPAGREDEARRLAEAFAQM